MRVRSILPATKQTFVDDRDARELVILNLFVAIQACLDLATHWVADAGWAMPRRYADVFEALAEHSVIPRDLAARLGDAAGFRNLVAHQYAVLDPGLVYAIASSGVRDLDMFCEMLARRIESGA